MPFRASRPRWMIAAANWLETFFKDVNKRVPTPHGVQRSATVVDAD